MRWTWAVVMLLALLAPVASAATIWGPYVTNTTASSATIAWKAAEDVTEGWVEYSPEGGEVCRVASSGEAGGMHRVHLTGLLPATTYHYRVSTGDETIGDCRFRTFGDQTFTCIIYGDTQGQKPFFTQTERHSLVAERMVGEEDPFIHTGDFVGDVGVGRVLRHNRTGVEEHNPLPVARAQTRGGLLHHLRPPLLFLMQQPPCDRP